MSLSGLLEDVIPSSDESYTLLNIRTHARETKPLVCVRQSEQAPRTLKVEHLVVVSQNDTPIFALEVFVYLTFLENRVERLLFVSKADTTGLQTAKLRMRDVVKASLSWILHFPIQKYVATAKIKPKREDQAHYAVDLSVCHTYKCATLKVLDELADRAGGRAPKVRNQKKAAAIEVPEIEVSKLCLFTRAEPQYLFPNSQKNTGKHVLSGEKLLRWWCGIVGELMGSDFDKVEQLKLTIPGAEPRTIERYFTTGTWECGDIFSESLGDTAVYRIPLLPDDPKGRFLEHLVVENRAKKVSVKQFWVELAIRQEFRLGITVGVIGAQGQLKGHKNDYSTDNVLSKTNFHRVKDRLVEQDYSDPEAAKTFMGASREDEDLELVDFKGKGKQTVATREPQAIQTVNTLSVKRPATVINTLVRKKPKTKPVNIT